MASRPHTVGFKAGERNVFFHILTACNLQCKHCYINPQQHGTATLSRDKIIKWLELFQVPGKKSNVIFLGGEPTMHPALVECIAAAKKFGYAVTVDSNGFLFHDFLTRVNPEDLDYLSFSLDGPDSMINDPIRGEGVFDVCTENMEKAVSRGFNVSVIYTVSNRNIDHLPKMVPLLQQYGVRRFFIQVIGMRGESSKSSRSSTVSTEGNWQVSREQWLKVVPDVAQTAVEAGIHVTYPKVFLEKEEKFECAGEVAENFFIFPNGRVYQCPLCEDHPLHTFEIEDDKLILNPQLSEKMLFPLKIEEGCVMNKLLQPDTLEYDSDGKVLHRISCCLLKQEIKK